MNSNLVVFPKYYYMYQWRMPLFIKSAINGIIYLRVEAGSFASWSVAAYCITFLSFSVSWKSRFSFLKVFVYIFFVLRSIRFISFKMHFKSFLRTTKRLLFMYRRNFNNGIFILSVLFKCWRKQLLNTLNAVPTRTFWRLACV